ncbi:cytochrome P450 [Pseudonocardia sp. DSM 110487]|nr:cytochrome P450 [Pseudonocardia sp. DSM 110487]
MFDPFATTIRLIGEPGPAAALRAAGPIVRAEAPAGGPVWIVTEEVLARQALTDQRLVKDPAYAPPSWDRWAAGLEPTAAEQPSLTTLDGPTHAALRKAHAPLLTARRVQGYADRIAAIARDQLAAAAVDGLVDLMADFTTRFPLTVICELLGVPSDRVDQAVSACARMSTYGPDEFGAVMAAFADLAQAALVDGGMAAELRNRLPDGTSAHDLHYLLFGLIFASQITTDAALGFLVARVVGDPSDDLVREVLRRHPPAPFTLWRFARTEIELGGVRLPERAPVLVDIAGINTAGEGADLTFGAGPHYCIGAQLAQLELHAVAGVLAADFPEARLAVPYAELRRVDRGMQGSRLVELPVLLRG